MNNKKWKASLLKIRKYDDSFLVEDFNRHTFGTVQDHTETFENLKAAKAWRRDLTRDMTRKTKSPTSTFEKEFARTAKKLIRTGFANRINAPFMIEFNSTHFDTLEECISVLDEIYKNKKKPSTKVARAFHKVRNLAMSVSFGIASHQPTLWIRVGSPGINHSKHEKKQFSRDTYTIMRSLRKFVVAEDAWGTDQADEPSDTVLRVWWEPYA